MDSSWSNIIKIFLRRMLLGPQSFTVAGALAPVDLQMETACQLQAKLGCLLTDGEGWMKAMQWNGHASMKPCWLDANVLKKDAGMEAATLGYVDIACSDVRSLRVWKPAQLFRTVDTLLDSKSSFHHHPHHHHHHNHHHHLRGIAAKHVMGGAAALP